jgi:hypothetical protein
VPGGAGVRAASTSPNALTIAERSVNSPSLTTFERTSDISWDAPPARPPTPSAVRPAMERAVKLAVMTVQQRKTAGGTSPLQGRSGLSVEVAHTAAHANAVRLERLIKLDGGHERPMPRRGSHARLPRVNPGIADEALVKISLVPFRV